MPYIRRFTRLQFALLATSLMAAGATAGVSVVQLYAGAFFPGFMLAGLYIAYVIVLAKWKPSLMPPLPESERRIALPPFAERLRGHRLHANARNQ